MMRRDRTKTIWPCILLVWAALFAGCQRHNGEAVEKTFDTYRVERKDLQRDIEISSSISLDRSVPVPAGVNGRIDAIMVQEGDRVRKNQRVARLSSNHRVNMLSIAASKGREEYDFWAKQIKSRYVRSPEAGDVFSIERQVDDRVGANAAILVLYNGKKVVLNVEEVDLPMIELGQSVVLKLDAFQEKNWMGKVNKIGARSKIVNNLNVFPVDVTWDNSSEEQMEPQNLRVGMTVIASLTVEKVLNALTLPSKAVSGKSLGQIRVETQNGMKEIRLGRRYTSNVHVLEGLEDKDEIIVRRQVQDAKKAKPKSPFSVLTRKR